MPIQFRRLDQTHDIACSLATAQAASKQPVGTAERPGPDLVFHPVVIDGYGAILAVADERTPSLQAVINGFCCRRTIRDLLPLGQ